MKPSQRRGRDANRGESRPRRRTRLCLEPLEVRQLLTAVVVAADGTQPATFTTLSDPNSEIVAESEVDAIAGTAVLYRHGVVVQTFEPQEDTDVARGIALREALAAAQFGDQLRLDAATYDMGGTEHVDFPAGVTVTGEGKNATRLTSSVPISIDPNATYTLNNQTTIEDLWLEGSLHNGYYQTLVGMAGLPTEDVTTYLRRVKITGDSDGIFIWTGQQYQYTLQAFDCEISTNYDAVALLGSSPNRQTVQMWNCTITAAQPSAIPAHNSNAVNVASGLGQFYNCTLNAIGDANSMRTNAALAWNLGQIELRNCTLNSTAPPDPDSHVYDFEILDSGTVFVTGGQGSGPGGSYLSNTGTEVYEGNVPSAVTGRGLFYNNTNFDGFNPLAGKNDNAAAAIDKSPLRAGDGTATYANVSSAIDGINGITIDLVGYHGDISADDFTFRVGNDNSPSTWTTAPAPLAVELSGGEGPAGADRVRIIWADGAITNTWLEVTLLAGSDSGLAGDDVFYFGNSVGDSGAGNFGGALVSATDEQSVRNDPHGPGNPAAIDNPNDFNRDRFVNGTDQSIVRAYATNPANQLLFINVDPPLAESLASAAVRVSNETATFSGGRELSVSLSSPTHRGGKRQRIVGDAPMISAAGSSLNPTAATPATAGASTLNVAPQIRAKELSKLFSESTDWIDDCLDLSSFQ